MPTYSDYQNQSASEKIGLVKLEASIRLMGWSLHSGSIYKLVLNESVLLSVRDSGASYTEVGSIGAVTSGSYFFDQQSLTLYLRSSDSSNPNSRFLICTISLFFSNSSVIAPYDLGSGYDVEWLPLLKSTSEFGLELDNDPDQLGIALEGDGQISLHNDKTFWTTRFDKLFYENHRVFIYSWERNIPITEAKLLFRGRIQSKSYSSETIGFRAKDFFNELRAKIELPDISVLSGIKVPTSSQNANQRLVYGALDGFRPFNIDQVLDTGYPLTGTISADPGDLFRIVGVGTLFKKHFRDGDSIIIGGTITKTVKEVTTDLELFVSDDFTPAQAVETVSKTFTVKPSRPKYYTNRIWHLTHHHLREPRATILGVSAPRLFRVDTITDFEVGDEITIGLNATVFTVFSFVGSDKIRVSEDLTFAPEVGDEIRKLSVYNVKINNKPLLFSRDYNYSPTTHQLTLAETAESNIADISVLSGSVTFTNSSNTVMGVGTAFKSDLNINSEIEVVGQGFIKVLQIISDTELKITTSVTVGTYATSEARFKYISVFDVSNNVLNVSILGKTEDGLVTGNLIKTVSQMVKDLLNTAGLISEIDAASFVTAKDLAPQKIAIAIPSTYNGKSSVSFRDAINLANRSVFGVLYQDVDFMLKMDILRPNRVSSIKRFMESDIMDFSVTSDISKIFKKITVTYGSKEYDFSTDNSTEQQVTTSSKISEFIANSEKQYSLEAILVSSDDAQVLSNRLSFILEIGRAIISIRTKLQGSRIEINEKVDISHAFMFERPSSQSKRKISEVVVSKRNLSSSLIEAEDLGSFLTRCGVWGANLHPNFSSSDETNKLYSGYWTDQYGMISNEAETFGINLWW